MCSDLCRRIRNDEYVKNAVCILKMVIVAVILAIVFIGGSIQW